MGYSINAALSSGSFAAGNISAYASAGNRQGGIRSIVGVAPPIVSPIFNFATLMSPDTVFCCQEVLPLLDTDIDQAVATLEQVALQEQSEGRYLSCNFKNRSALYGFLASLDQASRLKIVESVFSREKYYFNNCYDALTNEKDFICLVLNHLEEFKSGRVPVRTEAIFGMTWKKSPGIDFSVSDTTTIGQVNEFVSANPEFILAALFMLSERPRAVYLGCLEDVAKTRFKPAAVFKNCFNGKQLTRLQKINQFFNNYLAEPNNLFGPPNNRIAGFWEQDFRLNPEEFGFTSFAGQVVPYVFHELSHVLFDRNVRNKPIQRGWTALFEMARGMGPFTLVSAFELFDDSNYAEVLDEFGHPAENEYEFFASSVATFCQFADQLARNIENALDPTSKRIGIMAWVFLRDKIFGGRVFTVEGNDPFAAYTYDDLFEEQVARIDQANIPLIQAKILPVRQAVDWETIFGNGRVDIVFIGETHGSILTENFLINNLPALKKRQGLDFICMEQFSVSLQAALDAFDPEVEDNHSQVIKDHLMQHWNHGGGEAWIGYYNLLKEAKRLGIRVFGIDEEGNALSQQGCSMRDDFMAGVVDEYVRTQRGQIGIVLAGSAHVDLRTSCNLRCTDGGGARLNQYVLQNNPEINIAVLNILAEDSYLYFPHPVLQKQERFVVAMSQAIGPLAPADDFMLKMPYFIDTQIISPDDRVADFLIYLAEK